MYNAIVVGCGFAGAVIGRELANRGKKVLILEQRNHIAGNSYDGLDNKGIIIHKYGPHIFHTNNEKVYQYLSQFTEWNDYSHEVVGIINGKQVPIPFNLNSLAIVYGEERSNILKEKLINEYGYERKVPILELRKNENKDIRDIADYVYENIFLKYTMKQWGKTPEEIDSSVSERVPVFLSYDNRYFQDRFQGIPLYGYTKLFESILDSENINVELNTSANELITIKDNEVFFNNDKFEGDIIFTGALDEFFDCKFGRLPYRSLRFETEYYEKEHFQTHGVVNYTISEEYTRITEYKYLTKQNVYGTTIMKEYPIPYTGERGEIPYYAILDESNRVQYEKYAKKVEPIKNFYLLGRLAEYKYYNIDAIVERALSPAQMIK